MRIARAECFRVELEQGKQFADAGIGFCLVPAEKLGNHSDILGDSAVREEAMTLNGVTDAAAQFVSGQGTVVLAIELDHARCRFDQPVDHAHQRGLARARRADDDGDRSRLDDQRDVVDDRCSTIALGDVLDFNHADALE